MNTWPNRGASGGPCGGLEDNEIEQSIEVRPRRSDSSQQASSKPGAVHTVKRLTIAKRMRASLKALLTRRPHGVIHHSDQGSQYTSLEFGKRCVQMGVRPDRKSTRLNSSHG